MKYGYIFTLFLFLSMQCFSFAQSTCPGPAPGQFTVTYQSHTEIGLAWQAVSGAQAYEIRTYDATSGTLISTDTVTTEQYLQAGLQPGTSYDFELRSSFCENGPFGIAAQLTAQSNIVVVDIIFQFECLDQMDNGVAETVQAGELTMIEMPEEETGCYILSFTNPNEPDSVLSLVLSTDFHNQLNVSSFADNSDNLRLSGDGPLTGMLSTSVQARPSPMFSLEMRVEDETDATVAVQWEQATEVTVVYCSSCHLSGSNMGLIRNSSPQAEALAVLRVHPNPAQEVINIQIDTEAGILEIFDLSGRLWHRKDLSPAASFQQLEVLINDWPNGAYFARIRSAHAPPVIRPFMKLNN